VVPCCLLGSRLLPGKNAGVLEGDLAWCGWVIDALPLERGWLYSSVVDPGAISATVNCGGDRQNNNKGLLQ
jgi:hypothetical protein